MKKARIAGWFIVMLLTVFFGSTASLVSAHSMPSSVVYLDFYEDGVEAELVLPLDRLEISFGETLTESPADGIANYEQELSDYVINHVHPTTADGIAWTVEVRDLTMQMEEEPNDLIVHLWLQPPAGETNLAFTFNYDVIVHELVTHTVLVNVRNDWNNGVFSSDPELLGTIRNDELSMQIDRTDGNWWIGFRDVIRSGMDHIAEGIDHLLFLIVLLLPAPLVASNKRWAGFIGVRQSIMRLLKVITAFTIGHSITLIIGAAGWLQAPSQPIEILIAFSILVSAIHAMRPVFPGREALIAGGFGLVHGMAFATLIADMGFTPWRMAFSILGFNIGIELMQLIVMVITVPWLILLSRTPAYSVVRMIGACIGAIAAVGWLMERVMSQANPISSIVNAAAEHASWGVVLLAATAVTMLIRKKIMKAAP